MEGLPRRACSDPDLCVHSSSLRAPCHCQRGSQGSNWRLVPLARSLHLLSCSTPVRYRYYLMRKIYGAGLVFGASLPVVGQRTDRPIEDLFAAAATAQGSV